MASKFYFGNGSATPSIVERIEVPKVPAGSVQYLVNNGTVYRGLSTGIDFTGINSIGSHMLYMNAYVDNYNITGPAFINANASLFNTACHAVFSNAFWDCGRLTTTGLDNATTLSGYKIFECGFNSCYNLIDTGLSNLQSIFGQNAATRMFGDCRSLPNSQLTNLVSIEGDNACDSMFMGCTNLTNSNIENLRYVWGNQVCNYMFAGTNVTHVNLSITNVYGNRACFGMFKDCPNLISANLGNTTISDTNTSSQEFLMEMFANCRNLTSINFDNLDITLGKYPIDDICKGCTNLTSINFGNRTSLIGTGGCYNVFQGCTSLVNTGLNTISVLGTFHNGYAYCTNLANAEVENLTEIQGLMRSIFEGCTNLTRVNFKKLSTLTGTVSFESAFKDCTNLSTISFGSLTSVPNHDVFPNMLTGVNGCTVYFPPAMEAVIGGWNSVVNGFSGTHTEVLFTAGIELPLNIPTGYRVWAGKSEITNENIWNFIEGNNEIITLYEDGIPKLGTFTFTVVEGETTEFTFDPADISYETIDVDWTAGINLTSLTAIYTLPGNETINIALGYTNKPAQIQMTSGLAVELTGEASNGYLPYGPYIIEAGVSSTITLDFVIAVITYIEASEIKTEVENTFGYTGTAGFEFLVETIDGIDYFRLHSLGISQPVNAGAGYLYFNGADLEQQGYSHLMISGKGYASCENNYDFGYILAGNYQSGYPTAESSIKNKTTYGGNTYYINQTGTTNTPTDFTIDYYPSNGNDLYIYVGFLEDYMYSYGTDSTYISRLMVIYS